MFQFLLAAIIIGAAWVYWGKPRKTPAKPAAPVLPEEEARAILGLESSASAEEVRAAHRRLVTALHPDKGGSAELTRRINAARDTLLRTRN